jgi:hypothetical protein
MTHKAVILGNGPDRPTDIKWLNNLEGNTYGCNAIYRDFEPDLLVAADWEMVLEIINSTYSGNCHFTFYTECPMEVLEEIRHTPEYQSATHIGEQNNSSSFICCGGTRMRVDASTLIWKEKWYVIWLDESFRHITWGFRPQFEHMSTGLCALQLALETGYDEIDVIGFSGLKNNNYKNVYEGTKNYTFDPATPDIDRVPETYIPLDAGHWDGVYRNLVKQYPKTKVNLI